MNTLEVGFETKAIADADGTFEGYASVFNNIDGGRDIVAPGAFADSLKELSAHGRRVPMLYDHTTRLPIGYWEDMKEDAHGLYGKGRLLVDELELARAAFKLIKAKALSGISIGYRTVKHTIDRAREVRILEAVKLLEASLVIYPMNEEARVVKNVTTRREFEAALREPPFNFPASMAKSVAIGGFQDDGNGRGHPSPSTPNHRDGGGIEARLAEFRERMKTNT